jgi:outer membrane protein, heavy metal efflux system
MPSRLLAGPATLAITLSVSHAWGEAQRAHFKAARVAQNATTIPSPRRARLTPLGETLESVLAAGRQLNRPCAQLRSKPRLPPPRPPVRMLSTIRRFPTANPNVFSGHAVMVTQAFPLWGKRDLRREAALADLDTVRGREQAARDALDERIKVAFAQYYVASRALAVNQEVIAVTRGMRSTAEVRYAAGTGDQAAATRALGEETSASIETARLEGDRAAAWEVLNALLARPANAPLADPLRLRRLPATELSIASLVERARGSSPLLAASDAEVSAARSRAALAEKAWYPDLAVGAGPLVQTNNRPPGVAASIGLNIPLPWGREASEQQAATAQLSAAQQHYEAALLDIQGALAEAREKLKAAQRAEALIAREVLPEARAALKSVLSDYSQGRGDLGAALEAQHQVHDLELKLLQVELDEQTALAGIERLTGGEL